MFHLIWMTYSAPTGDTRQQLRPQAHDRELEGPEFEGLN